jgi:putative hydroxymethylpyrimidine transport system substrate-binding protein
VALGTEMKKISLLLSIVLLLACSLSLSAAVKPEAKPRHLTVILDWFMNPDHAPLFVAKWQGFFAAQDLDVEWINPADPADPPKWVAAGKADIAITYEPKFLIAQKQGLPLAWLAALVATPLDCMITLQDSGINSIQDFKGKRIGYSSGDVDGVLLTRVLKQAGLTEKDVTLINIHYNLTQPLLAHQVDVVTGAMRNFEPNEIVLAGQKPKLFYVEDYGIPNYEELIFITSKKEAGDPALAKFTTALQQGTAYLLKHPEESWQAFAKAYPELNNELNRRAWFETLPHFARRPTAYDAKAYQQMRIFLQQQGLL